MTNVYFVLNENSRPKGNFQRWDFEAITNDKSEAMELAVTMPNATGEIMTMAEVQAVNAASRKGRRR